MVYSALPVVPGPVISGRFDQLSDGRAEDGKSIGISAFGEYFLANGV